MTYSQIATLLNETIVPNVLGEETTIAEDLSNLVDLGTAIGSLTADQLKDYTASFVARVSKTYFDDRIYDKVVGGLFRDYTDWGGIIQRVKSGLAEVTDDLTTNLTNGTTYNPNVFVGFDMNNKVYTKDAGFELDWSVPNNMWKTAFSSVLELQRLISYIQNRSEQTINVQLYSLGLATLRGMIASHATNRIKLVTKYNALFGTTLTAVTAVKDADFLKWAAEVIINLKRAITDISSKYNDGTIVSFTRPDETSVTLLAPFATALEVNMTSGVYHKELVEIGNYDTVNYFQNSGTDLLPSIAVCGEIKTTLETSGEEIDIANCVGVIYDKYSCGITAHAENIRSQYNGKGDFTNFFRSVPAQYFIDQRENAVVITLE